MSNNWPQVWCNVNDIPKIIVSPQQAAALGPSWIRLDMTPYLQTVPGTAAVTISAPSGSFTAPGGSSSFTVTVSNAGTSGTWVAELANAGDAWITITSPVTPQTAGGGVNYTVGANPNKQQRTGYINVNNQRYAVIQAGA